MSRATDIVIVGGGVAIALIHGAVYLGLGMTLRMNANFGDWLQLVVLLIKRPRTVQ